MNSTRDQVALLFVLLSRKDKVEVIAQLMTDMSEEDRVRVLDKLEDEGMGETHINGDDGTVHYHTGIVVENAYTDQGVRNMGDDSPSNWGEERIQAEYDRAQEISDELDREDLEREESDPYAFPS